MLETALMCLAMNIYHEARGEPLAGRIAVAQVVINRSHSPLFPNTICEVVKQGEYYLNQPIKHKCQFSWWCDGKSDKPLDYREWEKAISLSKTLLLTPVPDITEGSLYYHSNKVKPYWANHYSKTLQIDNHIFYH